MTLPTWSHCIPTLNRIDILVQAVRLSLIQTCPAKDIIIVDAGNQVDTNRARIEAVIAEHPGPKPQLHYLSSPVKSLTHQRNLAIQRATGDILFLFDDDTLMFSDCAEEILKLYAADTGHLIAAAAAVDGPDLPGAVRVVDDDRKSTGTPGASLRRNPVVAWVAYNILMMNAASHFIAYDTPRRLDPPGPITLGAQTVFRLPVFSGFAMTVRAAVARAEPFDATLLSYCPAEDLDATYRFSRHGVNALAESARVHHFQSAASRIGRGQAITLGLMNIASFVARKSTRPARDIPAFYLRYLRRLVAEFLKDGLSRRLAFPQFLGALAAFGPSVAIFRHGRAGFDDWYRSRQMRVLGWPQPSASSAFTLPQNH
jgi:Glycosyl transferase family 2